ncbi:39S ribosomal protein L3, mitochondrial [Nephila pilipes]|uniref:Large ribosomal subunit protein uL3m n=1 Tax=Nephila pilipes TaxID=299642 RepID=A0A8X6MR09_NEPPI|nr:39S ribosomal protein L3, mitochondrial [Nephila pilipes]
MVGLKIWRINTKYNVLYVHGPAVPGVNENYVIIYDSYANKKRNIEENPPPFPTFYPEDVDEPLLEDIYDEDLHDFSEPSIKIQVEETKKISSSNNVNFYKFPPTEILDGECLCVCVILLSYLVPLSDFKVKFGRCCLLSKALSYTNILQSNPLQPNINSYDSSSDETDLRPMLFLGLLASALRISILFTFQANLRTPFRTQ